MATSTCSNYEILKFQGILKQYFGLDKFTEERLTTFSACPLSDVLKKISTIKIITKLKFHSFINKLYEFHGSLISCLESVGDRLQH